MRTPFPHESPGGAPSSEFPWDDDKSVAIYISKVFLPPMNNGILSWANIGACHTKDKPTAIIARDAEASDK